MGRLPARATMAIGLAGVGGGLLLMSGLTAHSSWTALLPGFIVAGIGVGLLNPVIADTAVSVVSRDRSGMAAGINDTFRQVSIAVGVAAWGAIFLARGADKISSLVPGAPAHRLIEAASAGLLPHTAHGVVADAARQGFLSGLNTILVIGGLLALAGAVAAAWLVREHEIAREVPELAATAAPAQA